MPLAASSSATNVVEQSATTTTRTPAVLAHRQDGASSPTSQPIVACVRPMRSQFTTITIEQTHPTPQQQQQVRARSATSCASEESEESLPDSLGIFFLSLFRLIFFFLIKKFDFFYNYVEEGRAPLLRRPQSALADEGHFDDDGWRNNS